MNPKLAFFGGVGSATGAAILLQHEKNNILVDCGILQGTKFAEEKNFETFGFNPARIDFLLVTHAHLDHIGRIPKLVKDGFRGRIISTKETRELAKPLLYDAFKVMKARHQRELYNENDIENCLLLWEGKDLNEKIELFGGCELKMRNSGHILGSAILNVSCQTENGVKKISFTGDLGNSPSPLLPDCEFADSPDYIVMESVYGARNHESKEERRKKLKQALIQGIERGGTVVISAFSLERTQILLYEMNNMIEDGEIPRVPVFLDSPLALKITGIYEKFSQKDFNKKVRKEIKDGDDIFDFPGLRIVKTSQESEEIENTAGPKIILAGSGMSEGGRVVNHEAKILGDSKNTLVLVGYQAPGTLGRLLEDGAKEIILNEKIKVRAKVEVIKGYSSHMDSEHLLEFVEKSAVAGDGERSQTMLKKVFVIMGEPKSSLFLCQRIRDYLDIEAIYPEEGREYLL